MYSELDKCLPPEIIRHNEAMSRHTTFKIGGPVDVLVEPRSLEELRKVLQWCRVHQAPHLIFGAGSNLLVRDKGIRGVGIKLGINFNTVEVHGDMITAMAGAMMSDLARTAADYALSGLEFAEGIPGTLGGAVAMNAGAYDREMKDVLIEVEALSPDNQLRHFNVADLNMSYRISIFQRNGHVVVQAAIGLKRWAQAEIKARMEDYARRRREKQPLDQPSAGSVFKRPPGLYVGPMLEQMGLKGYRIGDAQVSEKHAGFIVNTGHATAGDVLELIGYIQGQARERFGVLLEPEIRIIGEE